MKHSARCNEFKRIFNEDTLREVANKRPSDLFDKKSELNKQYMRYKDEMDKVLVSVKSVNKYIQDIDGVMKTLLTPDVSNYRSWNVSQILIWIQSLENGRFNKHIDKLRNGFIKSEIIGEDLPELTRNDLL